MIMKKIDIIGIATVVTCIVAILLVHIHSLSLRISILEAQVTQKETQVASFERSFCSTNAAEVRDDVTIRHTVQVDEYARSYQVHTPPNYDPSTRYPVVVNFDGIEGSGDRMEAYSDIDKLPVIAVYPDSIPGALGFTAWQSAPYSLKGDYDTKFIEAMLDELPTNYCVDGGRVFAVGMSNGGGFAMVAACELSDKFRAVASVSGAYYESCKGEGRQPSLLAIHSRADKQVPLLGSKAKKLPKVTDWAQREARYRGCKDVNKSAESNGTVQFDWSRCNDDSTVRLVVLDKQNHGWLYLPDSSQNSNSTITRYIWEFFKKSV